MPISVRPLAVSLLGNTAGTLTLASSGTLYVAGGNNLTLSQDGQSVTLSAGAAGLTNINLSAGTTSNNLSAFVLSNSNNVSFGVNGSTVTATVTVATSLSNIRVSAGTLSANRSDLTFSNLNGVSFGLETNGVVTASHNALTSQSNQAASAANGSFTFQTLSFSNVNGVSFATAAGSALQASIATSLTNMRVSAGTTSNLLSALTFSNGNGVTFGLDGSTLTASVAVGGGDAIRGLAANGSTQTTNTVNFSNANGVSFGFGAGANSTVLTASHNALTSQSTQYLAVTLGGNTAGTTTFHASNNVSLFLNGGNNITLSGNGSTITISGAAGGVAVNRSFTEICAMERTALVFNATQTQFTKRPIFAPFWLDGENLSVNTVRLLISRAAGTSLNCTIGVGFYSMQNATSIALVSSTTNAYSLTTSALWSGIRFLDITGLSNFTLSEGRWVPAFYFSASNDSSAVMQFSVFGADPAPNFVGFLSGGTNQSAATNASSGGFCPFWGVYSATTAGFPANVGKSNMSMQSSGVMPELWAGIFEVS